MLQQINQSYDRFFDLNRDDMHEKNGDELADLCVSKDKFEPDLAFALADIIHEEGQILEEKGRAEQAQNAYGQVLALYERARKAKHAAVPVDILQKITRLKQKLQEGSN